jgi:hypothetical protein
MKRIVAQVVLTEQEYLNLHDAYLAFRRHATGQEEIDPNLIDHFRNLGDPVVGAFTMCKGGI